MYPDFGKEVVPMLCCMYRVTLAIPVNFSSGVDPMLCACTLILIIGTPYVCFGGISTSAYQPLSTVLQNIIQN